MPALYCKLLICKSVMQLWILCKHVKGEGSAPSVLFIIKENIINIVEENDHGW